ncbi:MAG: hypothetical protein IPJ13_26340 [Saprospiraceae bacterium]|nr:hypothetical protein [Saprospiraceae bacterium]
MQKGDLIGGYEILKDFVVAGGMSKVSFARKGSVDYFIKEFLSPRFLFLVVLEAQLPLKGEKEM